MLQSSEQRWCWAARRALCCVSVCLCSVDKEWSRLLLLSINKLWSFFIRVQIRMKVLDSFWFSSGSLHCSTAACLCLRSISWKAKAGHACASSISYLAFCCSSTPEMFHLQGQIHIIIIGYVSYSVMAWKIVNSKCQLHVNIQFAQTYTSGWWQLSCERNAENRACFFLDCPKCPHPLCCSLRGTVGCRTATCPPCPALCLRCGAPREVRVLHQRHSSLWVLARLKAKQIQGSSSESASATLTPALLHEYFQD